MIYLTALNITFLVCYSDPFAPGHIPELAECSEEPGGEGGQPGAAGPAWKHSFPCSLPAWAD